MAAGVEVKLGVGVDGMCVWLGLGVFVFDGGEYVGDGVCRGSIVLV
jgi:hypothetical protein